jgi:hypothetical protein
LTACFTIGTILRLLHWFFAAQDAPSVLPNAKETGIVRKQIDALRFGGSVQALFFPVRTLLPLLQKIIKTRLSAFAHGLM